MNSLKQKYQQLSEREQRLTQISAVIVTISLFYWLVWAPMSTAVEQGRQVVKEQTALLQWVQNTADKAVLLQRSAGSDRAKFTGSLPQTVNQTAQRHNISITRMQPQADTLQIWVDKAAFNDVISWLNDIESKGINILDADFADSDAPGQVKIRRLLLGKS
ncbi:type II secretion system protein M [Alteromonadaceae bacterium BrNp21-10]|nr:type II secretion system protein M [Alteromonadaceae bacterium BrNp21-10]